MTDRESADVRNHEGISFQFPSKRNPERQSLVSNLHQMPISELVISKHSEKITCRIYCDDVLVHEDPGFGRLLWRSLGCYTKWSERVSTEHM